MPKIITPAIATAILLAASTTALIAMEPKPPIGKCTNWQSRCAMAAGGAYSWCDPATGRWQVAERQMSGYLACIALGQQRRNGQTERVPR